MKKIYYNLDPLDSVGARFNILFGERSNGKSYQLKYKKAVEKYLKTRKAIYFDAKVEGRNYN